MKHLFADTAALKEIEVLRNLGVIDGVTTNPSIISKEPKQSFDALIDNLWGFCAPRGLPLSVEVFTEVPEGIVRQGMEIYSRMAGVNSRTDLLYIKVPIGVDELGAIKKLSVAGVNVNCTCCYTAEQMMLAAMSGAKYVSIFFNRLKDIGGDPVNELRKTKAFILENGLDCRIIAGSIRRSSDCSEAWSAGADIVTCSPEIIRSALFHEKSKESASKFLQDFNAWLS
jgi:transaldolase